MICNYCQQHIDLKRSGGNQEKYKWCCMNVMCTHHETTKSLRLGSFFEKFQAPIMEVLNTIYLYSRLRKQNDVVGQSKKSKSFVKNLRKKLIGKCPKILSTTQSD